MLSKLAALRRVPSTFVMYYRHAGGTQTRTLTITELAPAAARYELEKCTARAGGRDEIDQVLDGAHVVPGPTQDQSRQAYEAEMRAAFAGKRPLDAMLAAVEWNLMAGEPMRRFSADQQAVIRAGPSVRAVTQAINPRDKAALRAAASVMQSMRPQTMSKRHLRQLF